jgi:shikimate dehydrogenase
MTDRYAVFGNPISHSKSPLIHALFAVQTGEDIRYEAILAPLDGFEAAISHEVGAGLCGANVTVPFKEEAFRLATRLTPRARRAGAVNTLAFSDQGILGDNTDGAGLVRDLTIHHARSPRGKRILLLGAGGAARGAIEPLLAEKPRSLSIANRTADKAARLSESFRDLGPVEGGGFEALGDTAFDIVINATSASLGGELPPLPASVFAPQTLAYDMMYGAAETPFLAFARQCGAGRCADGLGMLVEQAAEAFFVWRGIRPDTTPVLAELRRRLTS